MNKYKLPVTRTAEFVTPKHPDKLCDRLADHLLDHYLADDPNSRVAIEVTGGHGQIYITGEVTSGTEINVESIARDFFNQKYEIITNLSKQSPEIAEGVNAGGAGDQGIVVGYASHETPALMPTEYVLARDLCRNLYNLYSVDGKVQVTTINNQPSVVVASFQNTNQADLESQVRQLISADQYHINPAGDWHQGGFDADAGTTNRKLAIDHYGPRVRVGGGGLSGKDLSKTDRLGAYYARQLAVRILNKFNLGEVYVELAFAIGVPNPVAITCQTDSDINQTELENFLESVSVQTMRNTFNLTNFKFESTANWGHFGNDFPWDNSL